MTLDRAVQAFAGYLTWPSAILEQRLTELSRLQLPRADPTLFGTYVF
jgi:hypothetical protein